MRLVIRGRKDALAESSITQTPLHTISVSVSVALGRLYFADRDLVAGLKKEHDFHFEGLISTAHFVE